MAVLGTPPEEEEAGTAAGWERWILSPLFPPRGCGGHLLHPPSSFCFNAWFISRDLFSCHGGAPSCPPWPPLPPSTLSPYGLHSHGFPAPHSIWRKGRPSPVPSYGGQGQAGTFHPTLPQHLLTHIPCNPPALAPSGPPLPTARAPRVQPLMVAAPHRLPSLPHLQHWYPRTHPSPHLCPSLCPPAPPPPPPPAILYLSLVVNVFLQDLFV